MSLTADDQQVELVGKFDFSSSRKSLDADSYSVRLGVEHCAQLNEQQENITSSYTIIILYMVMY